MRRRTSGYKVSSMLGRILPRLSCKHSPCSQSLLWGHANMSSGCWMSDPLNNYLGRRGCIFVSAVFCALSPIGMLSLKVSLEPLLSFSPRTSIADLFQPGSNSSSLDCYSGLVWDAREPPFPSSLLRTHRRRFVALWSW
jgi:hypothetical protein